MPPSNASRRPRGLVAAALLAVVAVACGPVVELEPGDPVTFVRQPQTSRVLAADGSLLTTLHAEQDRRDVALEAVSDRLVRAVVATEDRRFFLHAGMDLPAIARAAVANVGQGAVTQGGSTLTQQYVKNTMTGSARTLARKLEEAALAVQLEQRYTKSEILERYLNTVYFGHGAYGVHAAAQRYFGVPPAQVSLAQAAVLAGLIASPSRFDPYAHPRAARARRGTVLDAMVATGDLTPSEARRARAAELSLEPLDADPPPVAPYAVDEVLRRVQHDPADRFAAVGVDVDDRADALFTGGLVVHTTIDPDVQASAEQAVGAVMPAPEDNADDAPRPDAAVVVTDPGSGAVRGLVGGRDHDDPEAGHAHFNLATQAMRQPGSAFKPFALATALSQGVELNRRFPGGACVRLSGVAGWEDGVCNYGEIDHGEVTLRDATVASVNTAYARLAHERGGDRIAATARALGFAGELDPVPSIALGSEEVTPLEMAGAYGAFADGGRYREPYLVERIETTDGRLLYERADEPRRALDPSVAYLVTQTLADVVERGTGVRAGIDRPQAGKTGTSQDSADAWFVGFTPGLVAAVWVGVPEGRVPMTPPLTPEVVEGGRWPAEIWHRLATDVLAGTPPRDFPVPEVGVVAVEVDVTRNCLPNPYTPPELIESRDYLRGTQPTRQCREPTGPPTDDVPRVTRLPVDVARRLLDDRGFPVEVRPEHSALFPPGVVVRQRPTAGDGLDPDDEEAVVLWVSTASRDEVEVPDVLGTDVTDATARLEDAELVVRVVRDCPASGCSQPAGTVWTQSPAPERSTPRHAVVTLHAVPG